MINCFYSDGMYCHENIGDNYIKVKSCEAIAEMDALEIVFDTYRKKDGALILVNDKIYVRIDELFDWDQHGLC